MADNFYQKMAAVLEIDDAFATAETKFREVPGWCSLKAFGMLVTLENDFGLRLDIGGFNKFSTLGELEAAAGV